MLESRLRSAPPFARRASFLVLALLLWTPLAALAQAEDLLQAKVKAAYVFNFIKFVDWPALETAPPGEPIRVGIVGRDAVADFLGELNGHSVRGRLLRVERYPADPPHSITCHVLYICPSEAQRLPQLLQRVSPTGVLTVSDIARFSSRGGVVGFVNVEGKVRIEINLRIARQSSLKLSAKLLEVATVYQ